MDNHRNFFGIFGVLFNFSGGEIEEGQDVTPISLPNGETFGDYKGKWLVLYFYPKDNTPGCTQEAKTFSSMIKDFQEQDAEVIGVSADSEENHQKFREKHDLQVKLLSDPDGKLAKKFGIRILFGMCARDTVLINPEGKVEAIYKGVNPKAGPEQVLNYIQNENLIRHTKTT